MRISLLKASEGELRDILVHVEVSESDDPPKFTYSHSFQYIVPSASYKERKDQYGEIIVYTAKDVDSGSVDDPPRSFGLERCINPECRQRKCCKKYCGKNKCNEGTCPIMLGRVDRHMVTDIFHTEPKSDELEYFCQALFKALFSGEAKRLLQKTEPKDQNGRIFLQLNKHEDLDAIPWEYAKDRGMPLLVHLREFARVYVHPQGTPQKRLQKLLQDPPQRRPLRIVAIAPDPIISPDKPLADLHLSDQWQKFIDGHYANRKNVILERVFPPTVDRMDGLLLNEPKTATVLHFMGHCGWKDKTTDTRALIFEHGETGEEELVSAIRPILPKHLWLAFLSACNTRQVARIMLERGVPYTIGSYCNIPDDLSRKFESKFYQLLAGGLTVGMAMWRARVSIQNDKRDYFPGAMILYSSTFSKDDIAIECSKGNPVIELHLPPNNIQFLPTTPTFCGRKDKLVELNKVLRDMANRNRQTCAVHTIKGIGGQGKTALAMEVVRRTAHLFPGGIFAWQFNNAEKISAQDYFKCLIEVFSKNSPNINVSNDDNLKARGSAIFDHFVAEASCLLILDHADTLKRAEDLGNKEALELSGWLREVTSKTNVAVKILATSQELLEWPKEEVTKLNSFDVVDGIKLFVQNLSTDAKRRMNVDEKMNKNEKMNKDTKQLLHDLVKRVNGHPSSLVLLGHAAGRERNSTKNLEGIVNNYREMLTEEDFTKKCLKKNFEPMIDALQLEERLFLYMCSLFTGPISAGVLAFVSYFIDYGGESKERIDSNFEAIKKSLAKPCFRGLLLAEGQEQKTPDEPGVFLPPKDNQEYKLHVGLRVALRQINTNLKLRVSLPIEGIFNDTFVIGVPSEHGISRVLEWQLRNIQANFGKEENKRTFGIQYPNIDGKDDDPSQTFCGLVVFTWEASEVLQNGFSRICESRIIQAVKNKKGPFILCLKHAEQLSLEKCVNQLKLAAENLQKFLQDSHKLVWTELPLDYKGVSAGSNRVPVQNSINIENESEKNIAGYDSDNIHAYGEFVGRQDELKKLEEYLNNNKARYITILGFGGLGKTMLALEAIDKFKSGNVFMLSLAGNPKLDSVIAKIAGFLHIEATTDVKSQRDTVRKMLAGDKRIVIYLDNVEDVKNVAKTDPEANDLLRFFRELPDNVKILATSRTQLDWPNGEVILLAGLQPHEGKRVFEQWARDRKDEFNSENAIAISKLANGHPLSIRLLGSTFNKSLDPIDHFIKNIREKLWQAKDDLNERYNSVETCLQYSFDDLDNSLKLFLKQLRRFETPFTAVLAKKALSRDGLASATESLQKLEQQSWLNRLEYDKKLGDWCPKFMEYDTNFYTLHPRLRDFLRDRAKSIGDNKTLVSRLSSLHNRWFSNADEADSSLPDDADIYFYTALCYGIGFGVVNSLEKQIQWCKEAAKKGHLEAQLSLAACYEVGAGGVDVDQKEAFYWYLMAASLGDKEAQKKVENCYINGLGVEKNVHKANNWGKKIAMNKEDPLKIKFDLTFPHLHRAVRYGQDSKAISLMDQQPDKIVNSKDRYGRTPLHEATEKGDMALSILLVVEFHAKINAQDKNNWTPLHVAAHEGNIEMVRLLVEELGADANREDNKNRIPFHLAMIKKHYDIAKLLAKTLPVKLNLEGIDVGDNGARSLAEFLKQSTKPTVLNLRSSKIHTKGVIALAEVLKHNTTLTELNLSLSDINIEGAIALGDVLQQNVAMTEPALQREDNGAEKARCLKNVVIWF